jgi:hypothetical protein
MGLLLIPQLHFVSPNFRNAIGLKGIFGGRFIWAANDSSLFEEVDFTPFSWGEGLFRF